MLISCDSCGKNISDTARSCPHCGGERKLATPLLKCVECSGEVPSDASSCPHCGYVKGSRRAGLPPKLGQGALPSLGEMTKVAGDRKPTGLIVGVIIAVIILITFIGSLGKNRPDAATDNSSSDLVAAGVTPPTDNQVSGNVALTQEIAPVPPTADNWSYSTDEDKVRGGKSYFASTTSTNTIHQNSPYDAETTMQMTVRQMPGQGTDVVLSISSGQFMCPSYQGCSGTVRFDGGGAQTVSFNGPADNSSDTIFVVGAKGFIAKLKKANNVVIEKTLYQAGNPQFEFDVSGLKWEH